MNLAEFVEKYRANRRLLLLIVYVALFLDNMLLTTVVPIPNFAGSDAPLGWNSDDWDDAPSTQVPRYKGSKKPRVSGDSKGRSRPRPPTGRMRPATTTASSPDSYEPLPDEFSIGFEGGSSATEDFLSRVASSSATDEDTSDRKGGRLLTRPEKYRQEQERKRHDTLADENVHVGFMFGSKALVQLLVNPLVGPMTNKIGYTVPMFTGFVIMFLSTVLFAFGSSFVTLWLARALQGVGSACTSTSGMGMLAQAYPDDAERGSAMGIALGGLALGVLVGPPYGGLLYGWSGKELPFILLALLALGDGTLQYLVLKPKVDRGEPEGTAIKELAKDPYIAVAAGSITIGNLGIAMLEPSLPLWMMESWSAGSFERGAAFLPASISYMIGTNIFGPLAHKIGRWLSGFIGLVIIGFCLLAIPSATSVGGLIVPNFCMGFSIGMIDASMFPMMGYIVDVRHVGVYGSIYAIADAAFCFAFALGPFFSGPLVRSVGFPTMMYMIAIINFLYAPLMFFLRTIPENIPTPKEEPAGAAFMTANNVVIDGNPIHYEKIEGITTPNRRFPEVGPNSVTNYNYNVNSVWED
ncbi:major facilitator superfamily domain-containing protein [Ditylenchus destructor]|uniref:Major facilitator superfamily domain-containing protein n=1 Tax=Ditylenchus destructor TaxID=166010 RepID=A0AAD4QZF3_9BILA|nr:major facilitator superfamily domain-containing protein [Ditylenchus destructor]